MSKYIPNSFQTPNGVVDELMHLLTGNELKVLLFTIRHIYGWQDKIELKKAPISLTMYEKGFSGFKGVGLSRPTIASILDTLTEYKVLVKVGDASNTGQVWSIGTNPDVSGLTEREAKKTKKAKKKMTKARAGKTDLPVKQINQSQLNGLTDGGKTVLLNQTQEETQEETHSLSSDDDSPSLSQSIGNSDTAKHAKESDTTDSDNEDEDVNQPLTLPEEKKTPLSKTEIKTWALIHVWNIQNPTTRNMNAKSRKNRLDLWAGAIRKIHNEHGTDCTLAHLDAFKAWWSGEHLPRVENKILDHYEAFYLQKKSDTPKQTTTPATGTDSANLPYVDSEPETEADPDVTEALDELLSKI